MDAIAAASVLNWGFILFHVLLGCLLRCCVEIDRNLVSLNLRLHWRIVVFGTVFIAAIGGAVIDVSS